jgi:hypothetical protein
MLDSVSSSAPCSTPTLDSSTLDCDNGEKNVIFEVMILTRIKIRIFNKLKAYGEAKNKPTN